MGVSAGSTLLIFVLLAASPDFAVDSNQARTLVPYWLASTSSHAGRPAIPPRTSTPPIVIANLGTVGHFTVIKEPVFGLLCIAQVERDKWCWGDSLLRDIGKMLEQHWLRAREGPGVRLAVRFGVFLFRSPEARRCHPLALGTTSLMKAALAFADLCESAVGRGGHRR
jgi:hypothetical protein